MLNRQTAESVIDHALSLGADFAELFVEKNATHVVSTLSDEVQSVESGINFGIGLRLVYGTKVLYGYTNRTDRDELLRIASVVAAKDLRGPVSTLQPFDFNQPSDIHPARRILSRDAEIESKVAYLMAADRAARAAGATRFVHVSTVAVYGHPCPAGGFKPDSPLHRLPNDSRWSS